jgi:hypothetical protein
MRTVVHCCVHLILVVRLAYNIKYVQGAITHVRPIR